MRVDPLHPSLSYSGYIVETRSLDLYPNTFVGVKIHAGGGSTRMSSPLLSQSCQGGAQSPPPFFAGVEGVEGRGVGWIYPSPLHLHLVFPFF